MNIPNLIIQVEYPSEQAGVISMTPPYNWCKPQIKSDTHIKTFIGRITYENQPFGREKGLQFDYQTNLSANEFHETEMIIANDMLIQGDGTYRIGLYIENDEGIWNEYYIFLTLEQDGTHKLLCTNTGEPVLVK